jgi:hypothetical protein
MRLNNEQLYDFFIGKEIYTLYHANSVTTSTTYFEQNGILSRGAVENQNLIQTTQSSDEIDKVLNVWDDVFLDSTDLHHYFKRQNYYGPILFEFDVKLILNKDYEIWITKDNPIYWNATFTDEQRYFQTVNELADEWDKHERQKMMITIRNNSTPILFEYVRRLIVDDPRVTVDNQTIHLFNEAKKKIKATIDDNHILNGKFITRECTNCWCRDNYLNQVAVSDLKRLFL